MSDLPILRYDTDRPELTCEHTVTTTGHLTVTDTHGHALAWSANPITRCLDCHQITTQEDTSP